MSQYYTAKRTKNVFAPSAKEPFALSRSRLDMFLNCPRCFYMDRKMGVDRPPGFPFNLNTAVDTLLKKEFDIHRVAKTAHPLMQTYKLPLVPFQHKMMEEWRSNFKGVRALHAPSNFMVFGAVDDIWVDDAGVLYVVDYKATSKDSEVNLDADWQIGYKRQMEVYQWLLRHNGFKVSDTGYFVYCNGRSDKAAFDGKLEFDVKVLAYKGNDSWIDGELMNAKKCLMSQNPPAPSAECDYCNYHLALKAEEKPQQSKLF